MRSRLPRRSFLRGAAFAGLGMAGAGCSAGVPAPTALPAGPIGGVSTLATPPAGTATTGGAASAVKGKTLSAFRYLNNPPDFTLQPRTGGLAEVAFNFDPPHLDLYQAAEYSVYMATTPVYSRLVRAKFGAELNPYDPYRAEYVGDLAESWSVSPDETEWTFRLRPGIKWQNADPLHGREFTAEDAKWALEQWMASDVKDLLAVVAKVDAPDKSTLKVGLKRPAGYLLALLGENRLVMLPPEIKDKDGDYKSRAVGTGPYLLKEMVKNTRYAFAKNPDYFLKGQPYLDGYTVNIVADPAAQRSGYRAGQFQLCQGDSVTNTELQALVRSVPDTVGYERESFKGAGNWLVMFRADQEPFNRVEVRRAVSMAIDRKALIQGTYEGHATVMHPLQYRLLRETPPTLDELGPYYQYNPVEARRLLQQAGIPEGVEWELAYFPYSGDIERNAQLLQAQMKPAGINLRLNKPESGAWLSYYFQGKFPHLAYGFLVPFPLDPALSMYLNLHSGTVQNVDKWNDPRLDRLTEDLIAKKPEERKPLYQELWDYLLDQAIFPTLAEPNTYGYHSPKLHNVLSHAYNEGIHFGGSSAALWWIDR
jgi:ABC-type transport system substrate-binding protein